MKIKNVVVIGSGTMGSGIAAHLCNANVPVTLLDLKTEISEKARERIHKSRPPLLIDKSKINNIKVGNINDNFQKQTLELIDIKKFNELEQFILHKLFVLDNSSIKIFSTSLSVLVTKSRGPFLDTCNFSTSPKSLITDLEAFSAALITE